MDEVAGAPPRNLIDADRVRSKLDFIQAAVAAARRRAEACRTIGASDQREDLLAAAKYGLQTAIQAMIDVAYHVSAKAVQRAPKDAYDALQILVERNILPEAHAAIYRQMVGFRNRVVHGYDDVNEALVLHLAQDTAGFDGFIADVQTFLETDGRTMPRHGE